MKKLIIIFYIILFSFLIADGPYSVSSISESDGLRNGPDYNEGVVYYPLDIEGPLPTIIIIPGFSNYVWQIESWGPYLASYGIVTMFVNVNNIFHTHEYRSAALLDGLTTIREENFRDESPLFSSLNLEKLAVGGYSMGGGGAQLAAQQDTSINAVVALSAHLNNSSSSLLNQTPILFISGELDVIAPNNIHTNIFYNNTPDTVDKLLFEIDNGSHFTVMAPGNNQAMGQKIVYWIEKYIDDDDSNCNTLIEVPFTASQFLTNIECEEVLLGDLNQDLFINIQDVILLVNLILVSEYNDIADMNTDNSIDILDVVIIVDSILN